MRQLVETYLGRFLVHPQYIKEDPDASLCLIIVIPCFKEPDILPTLNALTSCISPAGTVEVIILVNAPEGSSTTILQANQATVDQVEAWKEHAVCDFLHVHLIREESLSRKHAGAGWARKLGMDEALRRWGRLERDGPILCLDADCTVSNDYLVVAEAAFKDETLRLGHFDFKHPWQDEPDSRLRKGIIAYELHLRCHILGLQRAGYPFSVHTIGSCIAVRASTYAKAGGMNRRKAGEDFYFMHKILPLGGFRYLPATVFPSCRVSDRVPFGTGKAQGDWVEKGEERTTYNPGIYDCLVEVFGQLDRWYEQDVCWDRLDPMAATFLKAQNLEQKILEMRQQCTSIEGFKQRLWYWMDGFWVLKFVHYLRDSGFSNKPVLVVAEELNRSVNDNALTQLIREYRMQD
nr:family 2 glycosyl transferase [Cytophagales bacterium]